MCCKFIRVDTFKYQISTASVNSLQNILCIKKVLFPLHLTWKTDIFFHKKVLIFQPSLHDAMHELHSIVISATFFQSPTSHLSGLHIHFMLTQIFKLGC